MDDLFNNCFKGKTVLVTGDTGFKGSWLVIWLLKLGANVVGYSLEPKNKLDNYVICNLENKIDHIDGDIRDCRTLLNVFSKYEPEIVFHLAAQALVLKSYEDPRYTFDTNIMGTVNLFEAIRNTPSVKAAVNVTSDKCYENREWIYGYREIDCMGGKDPYSASKGVSEIITSSYLRSFFYKDNSANIASARAGNVIGGGDWAKDRIVPDCIRALIEHEPIIIRNPGAVRPWQHVLEPISGYLRLASLLYTEGKKYSGAWNFGPLQGNIFMVKSLVEELIRQWGYGSYVIDNKTPTPSEANLLYLDISKAINELKWHPAFNIRQTIKFTIDEYKIDNLSGEEIFKQRKDHIEKYIEYSKKSGA